jgi:hypothetical protein
MCHSQHTHPVAHPACRRHTASGARPPPSPPPCVTVNICLPEKPQQDHLLALRCARRMASSSAVQELHVTWPLSSSICMCCCLSLAARVDMAPWVLPGNPVAAGCAHSACVSIRVTLSTRILSHIPLAAAKLSAPRPLRDSEHMLTSETAAGPTVGSQVCQKNGFLLCCPGFKSQITCAAIDAVIHICSDIQLC